MKRTFLAIVVLAVLGFGAYRVWEASQAAARSSAGSAGKGLNRKGGGGPVAVALAQSRLGRIQERLSLTGALKPKETVDVSPKATGRLKTAVFRVGDFVKEGQLVAEMEDDELQQQVKASVATLAVAKASLDQREAELKNAKVEMDRARDLQRLGLISTQDVAARETGFQVVQAQVELARAQMQQAEATLRELHIRLEQTKIYAPMSGHVAQRFVDPGALLSTNTPILRLVNIATLVTDATVTERDVAKIRVGNQATIHIDAFGDQTFRGKVVRISPVLDASTRTASVQVEIPNRDDELKAEMFARVELNLQSTREAVLIPREGLVYRGQQPGVYVLEDGRPVYRPVETGLTSGDSVEVLSNLRPEVTIVGRGASMLRQGDQIVVVGREGQGNGGKQAGDSKPKGGEASSPSRPVSSAIPNTGGTTCGRRFAISC